MRKVVIGFSRSKLKFPIYSWLIQAFEGTDYSHVYLRWQTNSGIWVVYEASGRAVKFVNDDIFHDRAETVHEFVVEIDEQEYEHLLEFCFDNAGVDYGVGQALGIAIARVFGLKRNPISRGKNTQVCSETVLYFLREVIQLDVDLKADMAGPRDIYELIWDICNSKKGVIIPWKIS